MLAVKKLSVVTSTLLALLVGGVFLIPHLMDWSRFKAPLAEALSAACGRPVTLTGDVYFSVLPMPAFSASGIDIANPPGTTEPHLLHLERLDARVALLPLLSGRFEINAITLDHPTLVLETLADGRRAWPIPADGLKTSAPEPITSVSPLLHLKRLDVSDGLLLWRDESQGKTIKLTAVQGRFSDGAPNGTFTLRGDAVVQGVPVHAEATTDGLGTGSTTPIKVTLTLADGSADLDFAGLVTTDPTVRLQGDGRLRTPHPAQLATQLAAALGIPIPADTLPPPLDSSLLTLHAAFDASSNGVTATGLELRLGETAAKGEARFTSGSPPALDLRLTTARLDLAPWLTSATLDQNGFGALAALRPPWGASLRFDLTADSVATPRESLRQARLAFRLSDDVLTVERLAALGPGGSEVAIAGTLTRADPQPQVDATVEADADNFRAVLESLGLGTTLEAAAPDDRLRRLSLIARLHGRPDDFQITGADLRIDSTRMKGGLAYRNRGRPAFGIRLDLDHLDLDAYRPPDPVPKAGAGTETGNSPPDRFRPDSPWLTTLHRGLGVLIARNDVNLDAHLGHLVVDGLPIRDLSLNLTADHGALTIRNAQVAELAGLSASLQGALAGLAPIRGADLTFTSTIGSVAALEHLSGAALPAALGRLGTFTLKGHAGGDGQRLALTLTAEGAGGHLDLSGTLAPDTRRLAEPVQIHAVFLETSPVIRLFAPAYRTEVGDDPGPTDLSATLTGDPDRLHLTGLTGTLAGVTLGGQIDVALAESPATFDARFQAGEIPLDRLLPISGPPAPHHWFSLWPKPTLSEPREWSADPLDLSWLAAVNGRLALDAAGVTIAGRRLGTPALRATLAGGALRLEQFDGEFMQGRLSTVGRLTTRHALPSDSATSSMTAAPRLADTALTMTLVGARIERGLLYAGSVPHAVDITAGTLDVDLDVKSLGSSERALVGSLAGTGQAAIRDGRLQGIDLSELNRRLSAIQGPRDVGTLLTLGKDEADGETPFDRLVGSMTLDHGIATTKDLTLAAPSGTGEAQGSVDLPNRAFRLTMRARIPHTPPLPTIAVTIEGDLNHSHRSIDTQELQSYIAQRLSGVIPSRPTAPGALDPEGFLRHLFQSPPPAPSP